MHNARKVIRIVSKVAGKVLRKSAKAVRKAS